MDETQFWKLIAESRDGSKDCDEQVERLTTLIASLPPEEMCDFDRHLTRCLFEAYRWDLWGVAYIVNGGCSDDGFEYFCRWLIGQGEAAFKAALASPGTVGDLVSEDNVDEVECECLKSAAYEAYEQATGSKMPDNGIAYPEEPAGEKWSYEDLPRLFPELCKRFSCE